MQDQELIAFLIEKIEDMKGRDITTIDISIKSNFADYMIICSGNSKRHVKSIAQSVTSECRAAGIKPLGVEGNDIGEWALVDLSNIVVHIMIDATRDLYQLEELWS
ncbi:MAG: ribosome silencing factor [Alteromonadaceae bacterium]|nr:ribosome silencing factor [Alteromonadaceae bacterium]